MARCGARMRACFTRRMPRLDLGSYRLVSIPKSLRSVVLSAVDAVATLPANERSFGIEIVQLFPARDRPLAFTTPNSRRD